MPERRPLPEIGFYGFITRLIWRVMLVLVAALVISIVVAMLVKM